MSFYSALSSANLFTTDTSRRQVTSDSSDTQNTWCAGRDPDDSNKDSWCKRKFGPEFSYDGSGSSLGYNAARVCGVWTPNCTHNGTRTGDAAACCLALGSSSGDNRRSCPDGSGNPASSLCAPHWINRCNTDSSLANSNVCRVVYDSLADKSAMRPFLGARIAALGGVPTRDPWTAEQLDRRENAGAAKALCADPRQFAANLSFCKKWCAENGGECDAAAANYCASATTDPFCGCFGTFHLYQSDPALTSLARAGMTRCANPCLEAGAYVTASGMGINQCCAQFNNISIEQRALIASNSLANNLVMNCGGNASSQQPQESGSQSGAHFMSAKDNRRLFLIIIFVLIFVVICTAASIGAYFYFSDRDSMRTQFASL